LLLFMVPISLVIIIIIITVIIRLLSTVFPL
jgi:hypothetical protein